MTTPQEQTQAQLSNWASTETQHLQSSTRAQLQDRQHRHDHVMGYDADRRLLAARDTIDEVLDWNNGRGHLIVTAPGLPEPALNALTELGFTPEQIAAAITDRIDEHGNLTDRDIVAATAALTGATPGTEGAHLQDTHERATSREAVRYAEYGAYQDEVNRVDALALPDLLAETGHPDLASAREAMAEARGFVSFDHLDQVLEETEWSEHTTALYRSMTPTERALLEAGTAHREGPNAAGADVEVRGDDNQAQQVLERFAQEMPTADLDDLQVWDSQQRAVYEDDWADEL